MEAILSDDTRKLFWFERLPKCCLLFKKNCVVSFIIIFGTLSFLIGTVCIVCSAGSL